MNGDRLGAMTSHSELGHSAAYLPSTFFFGGLFKVFSLNMKTVVRAMKINSNNLTTAVFAEQPEKERLNGEENQTTSIQLEAVNTLYTVLWLLQI